jgi:thiamine-phosphate pyrophosphorylase
MMRTDGIFGFYPIVDRAERVRWLLELGVRTMQLRCKDLTGEALRDEVGLALEAAATADVQLYINDHWQLAAELGAERIHLGQRDLDDADRSAIASADLAVGISTHSPGELARALDWSPDYVALGPVWQTTLKKMPWAPQGTRRLTEWKRRAGLPLVAIGGITLERAPEALAAGADAIAIVSDIQRPDAEARVEAWLELFRTHGDPA